MNHLETFKYLKTFIFDVDGVFTNSDLLITEQGELLRTMNVRDGYAIKRAIQEGLQIIIITGGNSLGVVDRLKSLGIDKVYFGIQNKLEILRSLVDNNHIDLATTAYMGDDLPDRGTMLKVALPCCPKDADSEILKISKYVSSRNGGNACVRDVIEKTLRLQGKWI